MKAVEMSKTFFLNNIKYEAGHKYVMDEATESTFRSLQSNNIGISYPIESVYRPYKGEDLSNKKLMCWRMGGIGDVCFLNPVLRFIKRKYPTCFLRVASGNKQALENVPEINELHNMPFDTELLKDVDYHLMFQGILESSSELSQKTHAVDMFLKYFNIKDDEIPPEEKIPKLFFTSEEISWLDKTLPLLGISSKNYVIGIQLESSSPLRNFPNNKIKTLIDVLIKEEDVKIVLIGAEQQEPMGKFYKGSNPNIILATKFSVRQSIILSNRYDLVISPDSFMIQIAGALNKPLIGIYGPFPSWVRMKYFKNSVGLDPLVKCSPCFKHDFRACIKGFPSPCFSQITVDDVLRAADYLKNKNAGTHFSYISNEMPDLSEIEKYMMSADKGLSFFNGHYNNPNIIKIDDNPFVKVDINDLNSKFNRDFYPFILYFGPLGFTTKNRQIYSGSKNLVRSGGSFIIYSTKTGPDFLVEAKKDLEKDFTIILEKFDSVKNISMLVAKKNYK